MLEGLLKRVNRRVDVRAAVAGPTQQRASTQLVQRQHDGTEPEPGRKRQRRVGDSESLVVLPSVERALDGQELLLELIAGLLGLVEPSLTSSPRAVGVASRLTKQRLQTRELLCKPRSVRRAIELADGRLLKQPRLGRNELAKLLRRLQIEHRRSELTASHLLAARTDRPVGLPLAPGSITCSLAHAAQASRRPGVWREHLHQHNACIWAPVLGHSQARNGRRESRSATVPGPNVGA